MVLYLQQIHKTRQGQFIALKGPDTQVYHIPPSLNGPLRGVQRKKKNTKENKKLTVLIFYNPGTAAVFTVTAINIQLTKKKKKK